MKEIGFILPKDYFDFMSVSNGGEGSIGETYLSLWKIEDLVELNEAYGVQDFAPGLLIIGSDGGDTAYCIDKRYDAKSFVSVPFIGMDLNEIEFCGNSFGEKGCHFRKEFRYTLIFRIIAIYWRTE